MNVKSNGMLLLMLFAIMALVAACGGGSGGGSAPPQDGVQALGYSGNEDPAVIDGTNIEELAKGAMGLNLLGSDARANDVLPSALSRSLSVTGLMAADAETQAVEPMVRSLSDGVTRSAAGEVVSGAMEDLLGDILLEELHDRMIEENFPNDGGEATFGQWVYNDATGRYTIVIALTQANHCSEYIGDACVESFSGNGTVTISMAFDSPPEAPATLAALMTFLDDAESDDQVISVVGQFSGADLEANESLAVSGTLENLSFYSEDGTSTEERYQGSFFGEISFNSEEISLMATNCIVMTASGESETIEDEVVVASNAYYDTSLSGGVHLVLTANGDVAGEYQVITVDLANGSFQAEEEQHYATEAFHSGTRGVSSDSSSFACSGTVTVVANDVAGEVETQMFNLNLELGSLTLAKEETTAIVGGNMVYGFQMGLGLQASLNFTTEETSFSLEDLDLSFSMSNTETDHYTEAGDYEGYESSNRVEASLSGELSLMEEGEQVFAIEAPAIGGAPNMTLLVESSYSNIDEPSTSETAINLHVGRLSIIDQGAAVYLRRRLRFHAI